ncbi:HEAT repeat domain-containing protein [Myxococcus sp. AM010]|uniref:HEAT repeat domain-containing protein n=1 Tax=Myxococcus sp. AM010 TaxID=2745138 RepID=UPI00159591DB|nr:HEAT repeat domain-containing protein [Myxococcus sp. AM010]NVJ16066.1 HEAT repeat domain-containing protein [Myxococcus sp. AM010]
MTSRNLRWTVAAGVLLVAAAVALLWPRTGPSLPGEPGAAEPTASAASGPRGMPGAGVPGAPPTEPEPVVEQIPMPGCWDGLHAFDAAVSMDSFRQALATAIGNGDRYLAAYLQERLTELVGNDAARALQVLEWAKGASGPELGIYMDALKAAPAVHAQQVAQGLLKLGEDPGAPLQTRSAALDALETQRKLAPGDIQRLKKLALDETLDSTAWVATRTLGRVMKEDLERTGNYAPYWKELLDISGSSDDMAVRLLALEMPSYSNPLIGSESFDSLKRILSSDRERDVREMAAFRLGVTSEPDQAMEILSAAFQAEHDLCVRWAIFRFTVRAGGEKALPLLEQFAAKDPRFTQDYLEFKALYASGTVDFARIWLGKREHHNCLVEEGAPH